MTKKIRVGFLVNTFDCSEEVYRSIEHVASKNHFCDPVIIKISNMRAHGSWVERLQKRARTKSWFGVSRYFFVIFLLRLISRLELFFFSGRKNAASLYNIRDIINIHVIELQGDWSVSGLVLRLFDDDVSMLKQMNLDCLVRCGSGILKGEILKAARHGVISFHHGDNRVNRGGPAGFWEVLKREPSSGFIIQVLSEELDGGAVVVRGNVMTANTWTSNRQRVLKKSNVFLLKLLDEIAATGQLSKSEDIVLHDRVLYKMSSPKPLVKYICVIWVPLIIRQILKRFKLLKVSRWGVSYAWHDNFSKSLWRYKEIANPKAGFFADPFVSHFEQRDIIFLEDFNYTEGKGKISAVEVGCGEEKNLGVVLEEDFHLSFPFVFEDSGRLFMVPESHEAKQIRLYECVNFPMEWRLKQVLMENVCAADSMLIRRDSFWYLFANICSADMADHNSELHIFYSKHFLTNDWQPLKSGNPVIFDSLRARNGGIFKANGKNFRVNQVHKMAHYGWAFEVNEITKLGPEGYEEKKVETVMPYFKDDIVGTHHFSANSTIAAIDFCIKQK